MAWIASAGTGCSSDECNPEERLDESYMPMLDPAGFQATIDHPLLPYRVGAHWLYEGGGETIEVTVTSDTKVILGINATVVRDVVSEDGEVIEDTFDWYAQDLDGNVWYLGEDRRAAISRAASKSVISPRSIQEQRGTSSTARAWASPSSSRVARVWS
jgi:hypothetical protein